MVSRLDSKKRPISNVNINVGLNAVSTDEQGHFRIPYGRNDEYVSIQKEEYSSKDVLIKQYKNNSNILLLKKNEGIVEHALFLLKSIVDFK